MDTDFSEAFAFEIALGLQPFAAICENYGVTADYLRDLRDNSAEFRRSLQNWREYIDEKGVSVERRAQVMMPHVLKIVYDIITDPETPASVKLSCAGYIAKYAGYDKLSPDGQALGSGQPLIAIQIGAPPVEHRIDDIQDVVPVMELTS